MVENLSRYTKSVISLALPPVSNGSDVKKEAQVSPSTYKPAKQAVVVHSVFWLPLSWDTPHSGSMPSTSTISLSPIIRTTYTQSPANTSTETPTFPPPSSNRLPTNCVPNDRLPSSSSVQPTHALRTSWLPSYHSPNDRSPTDHLPNDRLPTSHLPTDRSPTDHLPNDRLPSSCNVQPTDRLSTDSLPSDH
ncbi:uncharacterized protein LOC120076186 [Benincasa hispida]|uniref:uncharacterized protein LOC120076186 n=1 Tax=Benincasa hispida TaxID=102211 RepID=UPI001900C1C7|nr:uncharacterized protein LOC120076186 [Benincasa hispida]